MKQIDDELKLTRGIKDANDSDLTSPCKGWVQLVEDGSVSKEVM